MRGTDPIKSTWEYPILIVKSIIYILYIFLQYNKFYYIVFWNINL
jgi:hypothetical protein